MKTKFAIGCLIQWYESEIIEYYIDSLKDAIEVYDGEVEVDICIVTDTTLEKPTSEEAKNKAIEKINSISLDAVLKKSIHKAPKHIDINQKTTIQKILCLFNFFSFFVIDS
mgnify:CR=1 FL=1